MTPIGTLLTHAGLSPGRRSPTVIVSRSIGVLLSVVPSVIGGADFYHITLLSMDGQVHAKYVGLDWSTRTTAA